MKQADKRLQYLNVLAKDYTFEIYPKQIKMADKGAMIHTEVSEQPYFKENEKGDIQIYYPSIIEKAGIHYLIDKKSFHFFTRTRHTNPIGDQPRYTQEKDTGIKVFFPKNTLKKIRNNEQIETLYLVEGEFKSVFGDWFGLDIIGVGGIQMLKKGKHYNEFNPEIQETIKRCKVKNICFLTDADSTEVKIDVKKEEKDYAERLYNFYNAVQNFKNFCKKFNKEVEKENIIKSTEYPKINKFYWSMILPKFGEKGKGLDDLIESTKSEKGIIEDLQKLNETKLYFQTIDLEEASNDYLKRTFYLDLDKDQLPTNFYNEFKDEIEEHKFWFDRCQFQFDYDNKALKFIFHKDLKEYIRVGTDYYREVIQRKPVLSKNSEQIMIEKKNIVVWKKSEIQQDYVNHKGIKTAFYYIPKYTGFTNVPLHDKEYSRIVENEYNLYHPSPYMPEKGSFENIMRFLKHLYQNKYQDILDIALDTMQLKYVNPLVKLPIFVLFSKEKNTGKSTFLKLLNWIYGDNACWIGNKELEDNFNEYASANVLLLDEVVVDKTKTLEMIKSWSTMDEVSMNKKGKDRIKVPFFGTMFMTTNRINFASIDDDENRFVVVKVPTISTKDLDPYLEQKMVDEIPSFLHWLKYERELVYKEKKTRFWFPFEDLKTPTLNELKKQSQTHAHQALIMHVRQHLFEFGISEYETTPSILAQELRKFNKYEMSSIDISNLLKNNFNLEPQAKPKKFKYWQWIPNNHKLNDNDPEIVKFESPTYLDLVTRQKKYYTGSTYLIRAIDFLTDDEIEELNELIKNSNPNETINNECPY